MGLPRPCGCPACMGGRHRHLVMRPHKLGSRSGIAANIGNLLRSIGRRRSARNLSARVRVGVRLGRPATSVTCHVEQLLPPPQPQAHPSRCDDDDADAHHGAEREEHRKRFALASAARLACAIGKLSVGESSSIQASPRSR
jgi:hypothetical protein